MRRRVLMSLQRKFKRRARSEEFNNKDLKWWKQKAYLYLRFVTPYIEKKIFGKDIVKFNYDFNRALVDGRAVVYGVIDKLYEHTTPSRVCDLVIKNSFGTYKIMIFKTFIENNRKLKDYKKYFQEGTCVFAHGKKEEFSSGEQILGLHHTSSKNFLYDIEFI